MNERIKTERFCRRRGITMVELVISSVMLLTVMTFVTSICFRVNLVWKDVNHHRVALGELTNQLEVLTLMTPEEANTALENLEASETCKRTLASPEMSGEAIEDDLGTRIVLRMAWHPDPEVKPVELAGWIISAKPASKKDASSDDETVDSEFDEPPRPRLEVKQ